MRIASTFHSQLFSMLASSIPPTAVLACCTSVTNSAAMERCLSSGCASGDSITGSMASRGLIKCTRMHSFGSETSRTLRGLVALPSALKAGS